MSKMLYLVYIFNHTNDSVIPIKLAYDYRPNYMQLHMYLHMHLRM